MGRGNWNGRKMGWNTRIWNGNEKWETKMENENGKWKLEEENWNMENGVTLKKKLISKIY